MKKKIINKHLSVSDKCFFNGLNYEQNMNISNFCEKKANKRANKKSLESLDNADFAEAGVEKRASKTANKGQTKGNI